jgi:DNA-binding response OmpR family regulator
MTILLAEHSNNSRLALQLQQELNKATGWRVLVVESADAARCIVQLKGEVKIAVIAAGRHYELALALISEMKTFASLNAFACPRILVVSHIAQRPDVPVTFERLGTQYLLRARSEQVVDIVRKLQWQIRTDRFAHTLVLHRLGGRVARVALRCGSGESQIHLGPRLRALIEYLMVHSRTSHTTEMIADAMSVSGKSVKEYFMRLRRAFDESRQAVGVFVTGEQVFWTQRISGGYVHGVKANIEIEDTDDFLGSNHRVKGALSQCF